MKTILKVAAVVVAVALGVAAVPAKSYAGDKEWATVGKVFTGIAAVGFVAAIASQHDAGPVYHQPVHQPVYCPPPPRWIPGHFEVQREQICIPGHWEKIVTPAQYGWVRHGRHWRYVEVRPACEQRVWVPERREWQETKLWVPGHYEAGQVYARAY